MTINSRACFYALALSFLVISAASADPDVVPPENKEDFATETPIPSRGFAEGRDLEDHSDFENAQVRLEQRLRIASAELDRLSRTDIPASPEQRSRRRNKIQDFRNRLKRLQSKIGSLKKTTEDREPAMKKSMDDDLTKFEEDLRAFSD